MNPDGSKVAILAGVDVSVNAGESVAVSGRSGSGKTTLLSVLAGLTSDYGGEVTFDGLRLRDLADSQLAALRRSRMGFVFQNYSLIGHLSALDNVQLPLTYAGAASARERAAEALRRVGLEDKGRLRPQALSGGEQQRVAVARAIVTEPRVVFADEPTGALDVTTGAQVLEMLSALTRDNGTALVIVTHDPLVAAACNRTLTLEGGLLVGDEGVGSPTC